MRLLILTQFFDPEPATVAGMPLAQWFASRGHDVQVLTGFPNYPGGRFYENYPLKLFRRELAGDVRVTRVPLYPSHDRSALRRATNYVSFAASAATIGTLLTTSTDAVYVYHPPATVGLPALLWRRLRKQPFVYHVQDLWPDSIVSSRMIGTESARRSVDAAISRWCNHVYRAAHSVAVISPGFKRSLIERGVPGQRIEVIPNWADESVFHPQPRDERLARELGLAGKFNVVYSGNLGLFQGLHTAIRAAARVRHLADFQLVFIGSGQVEAELRQLTKDLAVQNVRFIDRHPFREMGALTNLSDVLLVSLEDLAFFSATIPGKTQVALACGRPLLMAVRGDAADIVERAGAGITCPPGDEIALASAFERFYHLPCPELNAMGARGHSYYRAEMSLDRGAARLESMLAKAALSGGSPR